MATVGFDNKTMADLPAIQKLCQGLQSSPKANANNVVLLIQALKDASTEVCCRQHDDDVKGLHVAEAAQYASHIAGSHPCSVAGAEVVFRRRMPRWCTEH